MAFGIDIPQDAFLFNPSLLPFHFFILFAKNILSIIRKYFPLAIFYETLKVEKRNRGKILTCHYRVDFKYIILHSYVGVKSFHFHMDRLLNLVVEEE